MKHLIDKDALVAWAESQIDILERNSGCSGIFGEIQMAIFDRLYSFLDKLESKEVDLEREFNDYIEKHNAFINNDNSEIKYYNDDSFNHDYDIYPIAEYFFELGLKAKGE